MNSAAIQPANTAKAPSLFALGLFASALLVGCANPVNTKTAEKYWNAGYAAQQAGNWSDAQMYYSRSILNAEMGSADRRTMAVLWYEYGRASGVVCDWEEAQNGLGKAHYYDRLSEGPVHMSSYEMGRMFTVREMYPEAERYFAQAFEEFEQANSDTRDPIGYAVFLDEYVRALQHNGQAGKANEYTARARKIREAFPEGESHTDLTPYGTHCKDDAGEAPMAESK